MSKTINNKECMNFKSKTYENNINLSNDKILSENDYLTKKKTFKNSINNIDDNNFEIPNSSTPESLSNFPKFPHQTEEIQDDNIPNYNTNTSPNGDADPIYIMSLELEDKNADLRIFIDSDPDTLAYEFCKQNSLDFKSMSFLKEQIIQLIESYKAKIYDYNHSEPKNDNLENYTNENRNDNANFYSKRSFPNSKRGEFDVIYEEDKEELLGKGDTKDRDISNDRVTNDKIDENNYNNMYENNLQEEVEEEDYKNIDDRINNLQNDTNEINNHDNLHSRNAELNKEPSLGVELSDSASGKGSLNIKNLEHNNKSQVKKIDLKSNFENNVKLNNPERSQEQPKHPQKIFSYQITSNIIPKSQKTNQVDKLPIFEKNTGEKRIRENAYINTKKLWGKDVFTHLYEDAKTQKLRKLINDNKQQQVSQSTYDQNIAHFKANFPTQKLSKESIKAGEDIYNRGKKNSQRIHRKIHHMKSAYVEKVNQQCSFSPEINNQGNHAHVPSKKLQSLDYKEYEKARQLNLQKIQQKMDNDDAENTFRPQINNKSTQVKSKVYDLNSTYINRINSANKVLKEKSQNEYYRPKIDSDKNIKILSKSKNYSICTINNSSINIKDSKEPNHGVSSSEASLSNMLQYQKKNNTLTVENDAYNNTYRDENKEDFNSARKQENKVYFNYPFTTNTNVNKTTKVTEVDDNLNTKENFNSNNNHKQSDISRIKDSESQNTHTVELNNSKRQFYISPSFDARQAKYKELHESKLSILKSEQELSEKLKSESIAEIINKNHSGTYRKMWNTSIDNKDENESDVYTKNYNYAEKYKDNRQNSTIQIQAYINQNFNSKYTDPKSQNLFNEKRDSLFRKLFNILDSDHDDLITKRLIALGRINKKLSELIFPLTNELIEENETLNSDEFVQAMTELSNSLSYADKNDLLKEIDQFKENKNNFNYNSVEKVNNSQIGFNNSYSNFFPSGTNRVINNRSLMLNKYFNVNNSNTLYSSGTLGKESRVKNIKNSSQLEISKKEKFNPYKELTFKPKINNNSRRIDAEKCYVRNIIK